MFRSCKLAFMMCALATSAALTIGCGGDAGTKGDPGQVGPRGDTGEKGDPGDTGPASVSAISPRQAFLDRKLEVTISGNGTNWTNAAKLDFGAGINVDDVIVASPTSIVATITVDATAAVGNRDVTVTDKDGNGMDVTSTYAGAFDVEPPLTFDGYAGNLAQGSIFIGKASQHDLTTPFDVSGAPDYPYLTLSAGSGIQASIQEAQTYGIDFLMLVDVKAEATETDLVATSGISDTKSIAPKAFKIGARAPLALKEGNPNTNTQVNPLDSTLFSFTPGEHQLVTITATATNPTANASFALLPPNGKFSDLISYGPVGRIVTETADPFFIVYWDNSGESGYDFDITIESKASDDLEPNNVCDKAQDVSSLPASLVNLSLANEKDEDWFKITASAADVGKAIHVVTKAGDDNTDTYVQVFSGDCANLSPLGDPSGDVNYHEDHSSKPIPTAGTYYVKITNSPTFPYAGSLYDLDIDLIATEIEPNDTCGMAQAAPLPVSIETASLADAADEDWYAITLTAADIGKQVHVTTSPGDDNTDTYVELFSGASCANLTSLGTSNDAAYHEDLLSDPITTEGVYYVKISNSPSFPYTGSNYKIAIEVVTPPPPADIEPDNNTCGGATAETAPANLTGLTLPDEVDTDWFMFTASAADVGKKVHAKTSSPDLADTFLEVFAGANCGSSVSLGQSDDSSYNEDFVSDPIPAAGPYWVKVSYSTFGFSGTDYTLSVNLE